MCDWKKLETEFIIGDIDTLSRFFKKHQIKRNGATTRQTKDWVKARERYWEKIEEETRTKVAKSIINDKTEIALRQAKAARVLQLKGLDALSKQDVKNVSQAAWLIVNGLREERAALGLDKPKDTPSIDKSTLALMESLFGKKLDKMSTDEVVEVLKTIDKLGDKIKP